MALFKARSSEPLWREEVPVRAADERYIQRRQFTKFLTLTSLGMFAGNLWILAKSWMRGAAPRFPAVPVMRAGSIPVGGVKLFKYPSEGEQCILVRTAENAYAAYSQKCTHLSCAVFYSREHNRLECPCHEGYFSVRDGSVLQGPPPRPLPRVLLERKGDELIAVGLESPSASGAYSFDPAVTSSAGPRGRLPLSEER